MTRKVFLVFIAILFILGGTKVKAIIEESTNIKVYTSELDKLIMTTNGKYVKPIKYSTSDADVFIKDGQVDGEIEIKERITVSTEDKFEDQRIIRIFRNGYVSDRTYTDEKDNDDWYMATKIAMDCVMASSSVDSVDKFYKVAEGLNEDDEKRAQEILKRARNLVKIGLNNVDEKYETSIDIVKLGEYEKDEKQSGYYSQKFEVKGTEAGVTHLGVADKSVGDVDYEFTIGDQGKLDGYLRSGSILKVKINEKDYEKKFSMNAKIKVQYNTRKLMRGTDGNNTYIMYGNVKEIEQKPFEFSNMQSTLAVNFVNKETGQKVLGGSIKVDNKIYQLDETKRDNIILDNLAKGELKFEILNTPNNYRLADSNRNEYIVNIEINKPHVQNIEVIFEKKSNSIGGAIDDKKDETLKNNNKNDENKNINKEESSEDTKNIVQKNNDDKVNKEKLKVLPRTGNDYFGVKVFFVDLVLIIVFMILSYIYLKKQAENKQPTFQNIFKV